MFFSFYFRNFARSMKKKKTYIRFFAFLLLLSMLKVAFPVGEFFHNHHSGEELCTHVQGKKCDHQVHISQGERHHDCMFFQLHQNFVFITFDYHFIPTTYYPSVFSITEGRSNTSFIQRLLRGPPSLMINV